MLEYRSASDTFRQGQKNLRIKSWDVNGISLFLPITSKEKLIVVTFCSGHKAAHSKLPKPTKMLLHLPVLLVAPSLSGYKVPLHVYISAHSIER